MVDIPVEDFAVRRIVRAILQAYHMVHLEGVSPPIWKYMPCKRVVKLLERVRNLLCQGMTFVPLDIASILLGNSLNIADVSQTLFPLLAGQMPPLQVVALLVAIFIHSGDIQRHCPRLCICNERSVGGGSGSIPTLTFTLHIFREGHGALATPPLLRMQGGGGCEHTSHLGRY